NPSRARRGTLRRGLEMTLRAFSVTRRMHNKAWIADGMVAIVGGRNIGDEYFDAAETNFRDLDLALFGPAVQQTEAVFDAFWN
ncbi:phospholipase D family protein, partial [Rhizobiaceae sp. 2RAB30]